MERFSSLILSSVSLAACFALAACGGGRSYGGPNDYLPSRSLAPNSPVPHHLHAISFTKSAHPLGNSDGQPVYALFQLPQATPGGKSSLVAYGTPATDGNAGPVAQITLDTTKFGSQHVYVRSTGMLAELTDKDSGVLMLSNYPKSNETVTDVCYHDKEVAIITEIGKKTSVKLTHAPCPKKLAGDPALPSFTDDATSAPSSANVTYDVCAMSAGVLPSAADKFSKAGDALTVLSELKTLGKAFDALSAYLATQCKAGVALGAAQKSPCPGSNCTYQSAPVPISASAAICTPAGSAPVTFNAPKQTCDTSVGYDVTSSTPYTVTTSNASVVTASPASGSINGSGTLTIALTSGTGGGAATVTLSIGGGQQTVYVKVLNDWITSATPIPNVLDYSIPTAASNPHGITVGPDHAMWFTEFAGDRIGRITTDGKITEYTIPTANAGPESITTGPDGALWFTEEITTGAGNKIGRVTTAGAFTEYAIPGTNPFPVGIAAGPDGNLWFCDLTNNIYSVTTSGTFTSYMVPTSNSAPRYIVAGSDGALWFTESQSNNVARITTMGSITETYIGSGQQSFGITAGGDGNLYATVPGSNVVDRITPAGVVTNFVSPNPNGGVGDVGITQGPDGALWLGSSTTLNPLGRLSVNGSTGTFFYPTLTYQQAAEAYDIVTGPDGNLWFTDNINDQIVRVSPAIANMSVMHQRRDADRKL